MVLQNGFGGCVNGPFMQRNEATQQSTRLFFFLLIVLSNLSSPYFNQNPAHIILHKIWIALFSFAILYEAYRGNNIYEWVILL